jgi:hypothetical protein
MYGAPLRNCLGARLPVGKAESVRFYRSVDLVSNRRGDSGGGETGGGAAGGVCAVTFATRPRNLGSSASAVWRAAR